MPTVDTKIGLLSRQKIVDELKGKTREIQGCFFIGFHKISAAAFTHLRNNLKDQNASVFVTKNSLFQKAFADLGWQETANLLEAETGIVLVYDPDVVKACKILVDFMGENETLTLKGGIISDKKISPKEITAMAKLPSREILLGMAVSALASPITGFMAAMNQVILKFLWVVQELQKGKEKK
jgi:large subunit ribosomal protein L10